MSEGRHEKKGPGTMNVVLVIVLATVLVFIGIVLYMDWRGIVVQDSLIVSFFGMAGGECGVLGWIKTTKERKQERRWQLEDRQRQEE